ncbi:MAG: hypothetical protein IJ881_02185, partial [Neisseriaceae bacterium]|nr:hypothetical protein [Neisseriaceae bacterium]
MNFSADDILQWKYALPKVLGDKSDDEIVAYLNTVEELTLTKRPKCTVLPESLWQLKQLKRLKIE